MNLIKDTLTPEGICRRTFIVSGLIFFTALSKILFGCSNDTRPPPLTSRKDKLVKPAGEPTKETPDRSVQVIMEGTNISFGYFGSPIDGATSENVFTYPEKFGEFGTDKFLEVVEQELIRIQMEGRTPILTLEPYKNDNSKNPLDEISSGTHDEHLLKLFTIITKTGAIFRPMHEMDTDQPRYPWSGKEPASYITAWNYMYLLSKSVTGEFPIQFLWSPAGNANMMSYYPGDNYVDLVGFSLYDYPKEVETNWYGKDLDIVLEIQRKMDTIRTTKRIIIPEFGIATETPKEFFDTLERILAELSKYPNLKSIIFFNSNETLPGYENISFRIPDEK